MLQPLVNYSLKLSISDSYIQYIISSTMELCDCCIKRIQGTLKCRIEGEVQDKSFCYPQLRRHLCWLCKRFITWMQATHPTLFKKWRGSPLTVKSKLLSWAIMEDGLCNPGHLLSCKAEIIIPFFCFFSGWGSWWLWLYDWHGLHVRRRCHGAAVSRLDRLHDYLLWVISFLCLA